MTVFIIEDDCDWAELLAGFVRRGAEELARGDDGDFTVRVRIFSDVIMAIAAMNEEVPELIFLDVLLDGPDAFTLLNEMRSYPDLAKVPIVIVSSLNLKGRELKEYGVVGRLNKSEMRPEQISEYVRRYGGK